MTAPVSPPPHDAAEERGKEVRVFGPPGTGKTTWLSGSIRNTALKRRTSDIIVAAFTVTAAQEIAGRGLPLPRQNVGTLHSLAYRAIDRPDVAEEHLLDWNKTHPAMALTVKPGVNKTMDEHPMEWTGATDGDVLLAQLDGVRARMLPRELWPTQVAAFERRWSEWKRHHGCVDFTDMIAGALEQEGVPAPGNPVVGFFDEVQDFTPLELALIRRWSKHMERVILAGDDDQCIYAFKGATPDAFLDPPVPDTDKFVLAQSYRVPRAVHKAAQAWVERLSRREPKDYQPRDADGAVRFVPHRYQDPIPVVADVIKKIDQGQTVMLLATCAYMLDPVKHALRAAGVPFHNPYRKGRSDWNPLKATRGVASADRLLAYLILDERIFGEAARAWTGGDVKRWAHVVKKQGIFRRGAAGAIEGLPDRTLKYEEIAALFDSEDELEQAVQPDLAWFSRNLLSSAKAGMEYPITVAKKRGPLALTGKPPVVIGTIHSVKGGQADVVYLFPDLSNRGYAEWAERGERRDSVIRQMYVGMTRAKEELVICQQSSHVTVPPEAMLRGR